MDAAQKLYHFSLRGHTIRKKLLDYVSIMEKVENGIVYTVEGNSGDACESISILRGIVKSTDIASPCIRKSAAR